jgi:GntP family gluconate:H+ symporter
MVVSVLLSVYAFGIACGRDRREILQYSEECLGPVASVLLVVGAGGGFGRVLDVAGVGSAIHGVASGLQTSPLLLGWLIAALMRIAVGSATVAVITAAGIMAPLAAATPGTNVELLVVALGAGSIVASHVNDGGFWLVKEYFNLSVLQTLATWTVLETAFSIVSLCLVLVADLIVRAL